MARTSGPDSRWQHSHLAQPWVPELSKTNLHRLNTHDKYADDMSELKISQIMCSCYFCSWSHAYTFEDTPGCHTLPRHTSLDGTLE